MAVEQRMDISDQLLGWYDSHARRLPWRSPPGTAPPDPYRVWLSEVMLQQTTVTATKAYFERFVERWPTVTALAGAEDVDIMAAWAGLGYYARARNLIACARIVAFDGHGRFPDTEIGLRALPGIGTYTAAAIASIAFDRCAVVIDANVERVVARLFAIEEPLPKAKPAIRAAVETVTPQIRAGDFAQAMMDLGATICTPRTPNCAACPVNNVCGARSLGIQNSLPVKPPKRVRPIKLCWAYWVERDGAVLLVRRPPRGMLGGMRALPGSDWVDTLPDLPATAGPVGTHVQHGFTHFELLMHLATMAPDTVEFEGEYWPIDMLDAAGLPTLYAKVIDAMRKRD